MIYILLIFSTLFGYRAPLTNKVDPRCYDDYYVRAWVYFTDKAVDITNFQKALDAVRAHMNKSALERRTLRKSAIDYADIPLPLDYIDEVEARGGLLIKKSKWLNAASFLIARDDLDEIAELDFVYKITEVARFHGPQETEGAAQDTAVYGLSYQQLKMFNIDKLHEKGIFGSNVKVGILDTGLRRKHNALTNTNIIAEHDFTEADQIFIDDTPVTGQYGVYSDIEFHRTDSRLHLVLTGDTVALNDLPVRDVLYTYSTDNGTSWEILQRLTNNAPWPTPNWARELDVSGRDTLFIMYRDRYGIKYMFYDDVIITSGNIVTGQLYREPSAVQIDDTVYVVYHDKNYLYLKKGNASGFGSEMTIDSSLSNIKSLEAAGGSNKIGIFYHTFPQDSIFFLSSTIPAQENTFTKQYIGQGKNIAAISSGDTLFLVWKDTSNDPLFTVAFAKSTDFGITFTSPEYLSDNLNTIGKLSIKKINNTVTIAWETEGNIYFIDSYDGASTFGTPDSLDKDFVYLPTLGATNTGIVKFYCERGDTNTDGYTSGDPNHEQPRHGTEMVGLIGGYLSGQYVGVAPGAQILVAKTEVDLDEYEFPIEEDTWVNGLEWLESSGADIVNSSLGYTDWYDWNEDYDGKTSPASIAAYEATKRGVIVVNAAGNVSIPQIVIPGDAEGVITVGGIDTLFYRWNLSGYGPTFDDRRKPEIMCLSAAPIVVNPDSTNSYLYSFGTSGATAMISGICALLLEGHSNWTVDSVRNALFNTASLATTPNDSMGYGWPDALAAFDYSSPDADTISGNVFLTPYPNPFISSEHDAIYLPFKLNQSAIVTLCIYSISGRKIKEIERDDILLPGHYIDENQSSPNAVFKWDGKAENNTEVGSGLYYCLLITHGAGNHLIKIAVIR